MNVGLNRSVGRRVKLCEVHWRHRAVYMNVHHRGWRGRQGSGGCAHLKFRWKTRGWWSPLRRCRGLAPRVVLVLGADRRLLETVAGGIKPLPGPASVDRMAENGEVAFATSVRWSAAPMAHCPYEAMGAHA